MSTSGVSNLLFTQSSSDSIAARIRQLRKARGWTLADVEKRSGGLIKAVVIGSYERGDRSMSVERAIEIADLFGLPLTELVATPQMSDAKPQGQNMSSAAVNISSIVIDLRRVKTIRFEENESAHHFSLFLSWIIGLRQDWNGEILSLRKSDLDTLSLLMFKNHQDLITWFNKYHLLMTR